MTSRISATDNYYTFAINTLQYNKKPIQPDQVKSAQNIQHKVTKGTILPSNQKSAETLTLIINLNCLIQISSKKVDFQNIFELNLGLNKKKYLYFRPYIVQSLKKLAEFSEIVFFCEQTFNLAKQVIKYLEDLVDNKQSQIISSYIFKEQIGDMRKFKIKQFGRKESRIVVIDELQQYLTFEKNEFQIAQFDVCNNQAKADNTLQVITEFLEYLSKLNDVRHVDLFKKKFDLEKKQQILIIKNEKKQQQKASAINNDETLDSPLQTGNLKKDISLKIAADDEILDVDSSFGNKNPNGLLIHIPNYSAISSIQQVKKIVYFNQLNKKGNTNRSLDQIKLNKEISQSDKTFIQYDNSISNSQQNNNNFNVSLMQEEEFQEDEIKEDYSSFGTKNMYGLYINPPNKVQKINENKLNSYFSRYSQTDIKQHQSFDSYNQNAPNSAFIIKNKISNFQLD